jgi:hypothetical protein
VTYGPTSNEARFLAGNRAAVADVVTWIARVVASSSFWSLRSKWTDLHQEATGRVLESLQHGRFDPSKDFRTFSKGSRPFHRIEDPRPSETGSVAAAAG